MRVGMRVGRMRILLVEDDQQLRETLAAGLAENGMQVVPATDFDTGRRAAAFQRFDVIVLDIMLPGGSGLDLCGRLRSKGDETPILMLTAMGEVEDRVAGLQRGADDYMTKPVALSELMARLRALARRPRSLMPQTIEVADLRADLKSRKLRRDGREIRLTNKEWDLLELFLRNLDSVLSRESITKYVWDENHDPFSNALEVLVRRLRAKLDDPFDRKLIHTHRGAGYRLGT